MKNLANMPVAGIAVIIVIVALFVLSLAVLFSVYGRYKELTRKVSEGRYQSNDMLKYAVTSFAESFKKYGTNTNTPAIIEDSINTKLSGMRLGERFLNNAVSLFVTLGLFGTFLGLSLSVSSLTELISYSNTTEWLSVLDSVGGGLMSALSGMGVAFYTSLVGVACSILLTILRSVFSPQGARETLETRMELWLDESVASSLPTSAANSDEELVNKFTEAMAHASGTMEAALKSATSELQTTMLAFDRTVETFNEGVIGFNDFNHSLEGTVERMDLALRNSIRRTNS